MREHIHLIGIGGIGMSSIARLLLSCGVSLSGSDLKDTEITRGLRKEGVDVFLGHNALNIRGADKAIYSSAIGPDNPEILEAKRLKIPLMKRALALAELMRDKIVITVSGSHGKTTTTSLASYLLMEAGFNPTIAIGGILKNINNNALFGKGEFFVAEADESDGSFLHYRPRYSIITNIDYEHLDYYKDFTSEVAAFRDFIGHTDKLGCVFCCGDDAKLCEIIARYPHKSVLFGLGENSDISPRNIKISGLASEFDCFYKNKFVNRFHLSLAGMHNISNALAVIALGMELGINTEVIARALSNYQGSGRRIEIKFQDGEYLVIDDYAHHPTEIKATLAAIKNLGAKKVIAVFQPHRYTRTKLLLEEFAACFELADEVMVTDIYPASEPAIEGITGQRLAELIKTQSPAKAVSFFPKKDIIEAILKNNPAGSILVTLGAGDITTICDELVERIKRQGKA